MFCKILKKAAAISFFSLISFCFARELIIYRPENRGDMNDVRCWVKIEDEEGNDVTYTCGTATYEWAYQSNVSQIDWSKGFSAVFQKTNRNKVNYYQKTWYLSGGMAMHLNLKPGKYIISVYTPADQHSFVTQLNSTVDGEWKSNTFTYNSENPVNVIFVSPTANDNGFYNGGWYIDYRAPAFYKYTKPKRNAVE